MNILIFGVLLLYATIVTIIAILNKNEANEANQLFEEMCRDIEILEQKNEKQQQHIIEMAKYLRELESMTPEEFLFLKDIQKAQQSTCIEISPFQYFLSKLFKSLIH